MFLLATKKRRAIYRVSIDNVVPQRKGTALNEENVFSRRRRRTDENCWSFQFKMIHWFIQGWLGTQSIVIVASRRKALFQGRKEESAWLPFYQSYWIISLWTECSSKKNRSDIMSSGVWTIKQPHRSEENSLLVFLVFISWREKKVHPTDNDKWIHQLEERFLTRNKSPPDEHEMIHETAGIQAWRRREDNSMSADEGNDINLSE